MRSVNEFPKLKSPAILSPMAGVTEVAFRALAKKYGAGLTCTEFVSSTAIVRGNANSLYMTRKDPSEVPGAVQLFGSSVDDVVDAAKQMEQTFDIIDVNCGCPAWKVIKTGAGSELLKKPEGIGTFINKLSSAVSKPVTLKIRTGIDSQSINAIEVGKIAEDAGAAAIAIHGRTQKQGYSGKADWEIIKQLKEAVNIPVIGNGDVTTPQNFQNRMEESGVDAIMIARGAIGNPHIFSQVNQALNGMNSDEIQLVNRIDQYFEYLEYAKKYKIPNSQLKAQAVSFTKGIVGGAKIRQQLSPCKTYEEIQKIMENCRGSQTAQDS